MRSRYLPYHDIVWVNIWVGGWNYRNTKCKFDYFILNPSSDGNEVGL